MSRKSIVVGMLLVLSGCFHTSYYVQKDAFLGAKKVALVQYAINPHALLGTPNAPEAKEQTAAKAWEIFAQQMAGHYAVVPLADMMAAPAYGKAGGKANMDGYYTAKGASFFSPSSDDIENAMLTPDVAQHLCQELGVDAVAVIYDSWGLNTYAMGFRAHSRNGYVMNLFDKQGIRIWGAAVQGESEEGMAAPGGVISTDLSSYLLNNQQAFTRALQDVNAHL
jgi:hypothetical protein